MICYYPDPFSLLDFAPPAQTVTVTLPDGAVAELVQASCGAYQVRNLIATDPQAYLSGAFRPGNLVASQAVAQFLRT